MNVTIKFPFITFLTTGISNNCQQVGLIRNLLGLSKDYISYIQRFKFRQEQNLRNLFQGREYSENTKSCHTAQDFRSMQDKLTV